MKTTVGEIVETIEAIERVRKELELIDKDFAYEALGLLSDYSRFLLQRVVEV